MEHATPVSAALERLRERFVEGAETRRRPFVTLTYAQSLDGSIAARRGRPLALSGPDALVLTHRLRAAHDAVLIGVGTLLSDDPRLTVRHVPGENPIPVVLDSRLRTPLGARLLAHPSRRPVLATTGAATRAREAALEAAGARVVRLLADPRGRVSLDALLAHLHEHGIASVMVEGGARVITSFLRSRRVDLVIVTIASILVGGLRAVGPLTAAGTAPPRLAGVDVFRLGDDVILCGTPVWTAAPRAPEHV